MNHLDIFLVSWQVLNAFSGQADPEMKTKVIMRLTHLTDVQKLLEKCLAGA